jgi:BirA family biotin operon repressor/biotin-[acetyl-CoA-carboxylase] ligase
VEEGFDKVRRTWLNRAIGKGKGIEVRLENETLTGNFKDLDDDGALILEDDGAERRIAAGVVYFPDN